MPSPNKPVPGPRTEGSFLQLQDPWDWTVDQVVFALTDQESLLLKENQTLALPNAKQFADTLHDNDVTGLALLTEVHAVSLREDLKVKSMGHRASINHLIRQLQNISTKYQEQLLKSGRASSMGMNAGIGTQLLARSQSLEPGLVPHISALRTSPTPRSCRLQVSSWIDGVPSPAQAQSYIPRHLTTVEAQDMSKPDLEMVGTRGPPPGTGGSLPETANEETGPHESESHDNNTIMDGKESAEHRVIKSESDSPCPERSPRRGETAVIDETGRTRRRLILSPSSGLEPAVCATPEPPVSREGQSAQETSPNIADSHESFEKMPSHRAGSAGLQDRDSEFAKTTIDANVDPTPFGNKVEASEPGTVFVDEHGRKRLRPTLLTQPDTVTTDNIQENTDSLEKCSLNVKPPSSIQPASIGRKAFRRDDQSYLGIEPVVVDSLFYADAPLESQLDQPTESDHTDDNDNFIIISKPNSGSGCSIYVNNRMKYFFQSRTFKVQSGKHKGSGIVPYPDHLGRKHYPLSVTVFQESPHGISVIRSNRAKWIKDTSHPSPNCPGDKQADAFGLSDPVFAQDDGDDPEWKSLEKWNYMNADDVVLPIYGDSGSEGEYDPDIWKEIEQERGKIKKTVRKLGNQNLSYEEVEEAIALALKQLVDEWQSKRQPKLQLKTWRFKMKYRRKNNLMAQKDHLTQEIHLLDNRITTLRNEILGLEWSKSDHVSKQCKVFQPTVFDREDTRWKLAVLDLDENVVKPPPKARVPTTAGVPGPEQALDNHEKSLAQDSGISDASEDSLDGFVVPDDDAIDDFHPVLVGGSPAFADVGNAVNSEAIIEEDANSTMVKVPESKPVFRMPSQYNTKIKVEVPLSTSSNLPVVDLTLDSDSMEQGSPDIKPERSFEIKTPPVVTSDSDDDGLRRKRPKFKQPWLPRSTTVIDLESDLSEDSATESVPVAKKPLPTFDNVMDIRSMNPSELVERQDRKRLLIWVIAHTAAARRQAISTYLTQTSFEKCQSNVTDALEGMRAHRRRMPGMDNSKSDSIMSIASWHVCWTIPVKLDSSGLKTSHINATLSDEDGFEPFYDFLLECLNFCQIALDSTSLVASAKKRQKIQRGPEENLGSSPLRKRKYIVNESQETLDKRQAAQDRMRGDEERRREEQRRQKELRYRIEKMGADGPSEVVVNPGKLKDQDFINLNHAFGNGARLKEHQKEGLQFLWREITAEHDDLQGCLLAQSMGLGKTMQVIALLVTLAEASKSSNPKISNQVPPDHREPRTLVLCPPALLENWWDEFLIWAPKPFSENIGEVRKVNAALRAADRLSEIEAWSSKGGVLLLGYDTFKTLIHNKARVKTKLKIAKSPLTESEHEKVKEALLRRANLIVADEAHNFKARKSMINLAMRQFETRSRIAMTGSPLNNNLEEYFTLIDWIAPKYLGTYTEFKANYEEPIQDGLYQDSTQRQFIQSRTKLKALEMELEPKVNRADVSVLRTDLQGKMEFVIRVPLSPVQEDIYRIFVDSMRATLSNEEPSQTFLWSWLGVLQLLCNHPQCFRERILAMKADVRAKSDGSPQVKPTIPKTAEDVVGGSDEDAILLAEPETSKPFTRAIDNCEEGFNKVGGSTDELSLSYKMCILMKILELTDAAQDKALVFSHRIATLDYIQQQLEKGRKLYARIDGKLPTQKRQQITKDFNEGNINICLISTRAGGTGLNLFGANRVVILDEHFNPTWEQQAIGRAYRIGQQKIVYVYRLTTGGTFEKAIQNQALFKEQLADRVVDRKNPCRNALRGVGHYLFPPEPVEQEPLEQFAGKDPAVLDNLLANAVQYHIRSIIPSETLHVEDDFELTPEMRSEAKEIVESERLRRRNPQAHSEMMRAKRAKQIQSVQDHTRLPNPSISEPISWGSAFTHDQTLPPVSNFSVQPTHMGGLPLYNSIPRIPYSLGIGQHGPPFPSAPRSMEANMEPIADTSNADQAEKDGTTLKTPGSNRISPMRETLYALTEPQPQRTSQISQEAANVIELSDEDLPVVNPSENKVSSDTSASRWGQDGQSDSRESRNGKRSLPEEQSQPNKRHKWTPTAFPPPFVGSMEDLFHNLLNREAARSN